jgi:hypothetical protein
MIQRTLAVTIPKALDGDRLVGERATSDLGLLAGEPDG